MTPLLPGIHSQLNATARAELISLGRETDTQLRDEGLYHWARRQDQRGRPDLAAQAYVFLGESGSALAERASQRLTELAGGGTFGARLERQTRTFLQHAADPGTLVGMAVGSTAFSFARNLALARFAGWGGRRLLASGVGLAAEVPAFWLTSKGIGELRHPGIQRWDPATNARELAGLGLTLGILRSAGALTRGGLNRWGGENLPALTRAWAPRLAMVGGVYLSRGIEESLGWRRPQSAPERLLDSAISVLQFEVGGHLSRRLFPGLARWTRELDAQSQGLQHPPPRRPTWSETWNGLSQAFGSLHPSRAAWAVAPLAIGEGSTAATILGLGAMAMIGASRSGEALTRLPEVTPDEFFDWVKSGRDFYLVDIREAPEYEGQGVIRLRHSPRNLRAPLPLDPEREDPAAKEFDLPAFAENFRTLNLDPSLPVLFICRVGNRTNHEVVDGLRLLGLDQGSGEAPRFHSLGGGTYGLLSRAMQVAKDPELSQRLQFVAGPDYFQHRGKMAEALRPFLNRLSSKDQ